MGACFNSRTFDIEDKAEILKRWDEAVANCLYENGHSYSGGIGMLGHGIQFRSETFKNRDEAEEFILQHQEKWGPAMGVKFSSDNGKGWVVGGWCSS
jgi:hypothetical protein